MLYCCTSPLSAGATFLAFASSSSHIRLNPFSLHCQQPLMVEMRRISRSATFIHNVILTFAAQWVIPTAWASGDQPGLPSPIRLVTSTARRLFGRRRYRHTSVNVQYTPGLEKSSISLTNTARPATMPITEGGVQRMVTTALPSLSLWVMVVDHSLTAQACQDNFMDDFALVISIWSRRFGIELCGRRLPRTLCKIRVAKIFERSAWRISQLLHGLHRVSTAKAVLLHIEVFQNIELYDMNTAGRWRWHGNKPDAIIAAYRCAFDRCHAR